MSRSAIHALFTAIAVLITGPAAAGAQSAKPPAPVPVFGMPVRWLDASGQNEGMVLAVAADGRLVTSCCSHRSPLMAYVAGQHSVTLDPTTTPGLKLAVGRQSRSKWAAIGALIGAGGMAVIGGFFYYAMNSSCTPSGFIDFCEKPEFSRVAKGIAIGAVSGALIGASAPRRQWQSFAAGPTASQHAVAIRPLATWHNGPALGVHLTF